MQKAFRRHLCQKYNKLHGPAYLNRSLCTNDTDFVTMDELTSLRPCQFFSYTDSDGFVYGFNIVSILKLLFSSTTKLVRTFDPKNPYNRCKIPYVITMKLRKIIMLSQLLKIPLLTEYPTEYSLDATFAKKIEFRALRLFQSINDCGHYSDPLWFLSLPRPSIIIFIMELKDIWNYRAQLSDQVKCEICYPSGNPFADFVYSIKMSVTHLDQTDFIRDAALDVLELMIENSIDDSSKSLGCFYILGALTIVSNQAAEAMPELYQSMSNV